MLKIEELLERIEPVSFDELDPKSKFIQVLNEFPEFKEKLKKEISLEENAEWIKKAEKSKVYFIIYDDSWKKTKSHFPNSITLSFVGVNRTPTVSIDIHIKKNQS